nr:MAG TPA: hypothetical protein [Caudoviricetes sp.]
MAVTVKYSLRWGELTGKVRVVALSHPAGAPAEGSSHPINRGVFADIVLPGVVGGSVRYALVPMVYDSEGLLRLDLPVLVVDVAPGAGKVVSLDDLVFLRDAQRAIVTTGGMSLASISSGAPGASPLPGPAPGGVGFTDNGDGTVSFEKIGA